MILARTRPPFLPTPVLAFDKAKTGGFAKARRAEIQYSAQLRKIARHIGDLVNGLWHPDDPESVTRIRDALERYSVILEPWAGAVARRMLEEVASRDYRVWRELSDKMGRALHREIMTAPTGALMRQRLAEQVTLIKSLPLEAAQRVHRLTTEALVTGQRPSAIAAEIMRSGEVTASRATLIARTEVGRTSTELARARSEHIGGPGYIWRTSRDKDVRKEHRALEGKFFSWDAPPIAGPDGERYAPGAGPNCRCSPEIVIPQTV